MAENTAAIPKGCQLLDSWELSRVNPSVGKNRLFSSFSGVVAALTLIAMLPKLLLLSEEMTNQAAHWQNLLWAVPAVVLAWLLCVLLSGGKSRMHFVGVQVFPGWRGVLKRKQFTRCCVLPPLGVLVMTIVAFYLLPPSLMIAAMAAALFLACVLGTTVMLVFKLADVPDNTLLLLDGKWLRLCEQTD